VMWWGIMEYIMHGHIKPRVSPLAFYTKSGCTFPCKTIIMLVQVVGIVIISEVSMTIYISV